MNFLAALAGIVVLVAVDQASKLAVAAYLATQRSVSLWGEYVKLTLAQNPGGAFGILPEHGSLLTVLTVAVVTGILIFLGRGGRKSPGMSTGLVAIAGGAVGNLMDRLRLGYVVDFVDVGISAAWRWPTFNVADAAIVIGTGLLLWRLLAQEIRS